ncbi:MAG: aldose epimerase family protein [Pseudomonadota bacterium]
MIRTVGHIDGREVREARLESGAARVAVLSYGAVIRDWRVAAAGREVPCVLGFPDVAAYPAHSKSFGIIAGRVANRIAGARFPLNGEIVQLQPNEGRTHLHGGPIGLGKRIWEMEADGAGVLLRYDSPDGEMGYPGRVLFEVRLRLDGPRLAFEMRGAPDRPTPINLAQHNYYNLNGQGDTRGHRLRIAASRYTPVDAELIPTGEMASVAGMHLDFRAPAPVDPAGDGIDLNLVLDERDTRQEAAVLASPESGLRLSLFTDQPGLQLFNAPRMEIAVPGHDGARYGAFGGICLEPQHFPDSPNKPDWASILATPERPYVQRLAVEIGPGTL